MLVGTKFKGVDFYNTEELLSEEEKMVRDTVRNGLTRGLYR
jgi:hypothetical protein